MERSLPRKKKQTRRNRVRKIKVRVLRTKREVRVNLRSPRDLAMGKKVPKTIKKLKRKKKLGVNQDRKKEEPKQDRMGLARNLRKRRKNNSLLRLYNDLIYCLASLDARPPLD